MQDVIAKVVQLDEEVYQRLRGIALSRSIPKNEKLIRAGAPVRKVFFLESGAVRAFRNVEGTDYTHFFFTERWFVTDFAGFITGEPSSITIEAATDCQCYEFDKKAIEELNGQYPELEKLWRIVAERAYLCTVKRLEHLQTTSLQERYQRLVEQHPDLLLTFPQKHIASYLGVAEQSLSRIKKR